MIMISFLACTKLELLGLTVLMRYMEKNLKPYSDLDLDPTVSNIKLVRANFIKYNVFTFHVDYFELLC